MRVVSDSQLGTFMGIRVNSVHPGGIYTEMAGAGHIWEEILNKDVYADFPIARVGQSKEVANVTPFFENPAR